MNNSVESLLCLFTKTRQIKSQQETHVDLQLKYSTQSISCPQIDDLKTCFTLFPARDEIELITSIAGADGIYFKSNNELNYQESLNELDGQIRSSETGDEIIIQLNIFKKPKAGEVSVYDFSLFVSHLSQRSIQEQFSIFDNFFQVAPTLTFVCPSISKPFNTESILFRPSGPDVFSPLNTERHKKLEQRSDVAHFAEGTIYRLTPDDFHVRGGDALGLAPILENLKNILSFAFLADFTGLGSDSLNYKINGYRSLLGTIKLSDIPHAGWTAIHNCYTWAYSGGEISDKIGLLRNISTLHLSEKGWPRFDIETLKSVKSGYEIYLRKNIEQYIEIKNQVAEFLSNLRKSIRDEARQYSGALVQTLGALLTFFITTFIINAVSSGKLTDIFTRDVVFLTYAFLGGSILFLLISLNTFQKQRASLIQDLDILKEQYSDLLDPADSQKIFDNDTSLSGVLKDSKSSARGTTIAWVLMVIILGGTVSVLRVSDAASTNSPVIPSDKTKLNTPSPSEIVVPQSFSQEPPMDLPSASLNQDSTTK